MNVEVAGDAQLPALGKLTLYLYLRSVPHCALRSKVNGNDCQCTVTVVATLPLLIAQCRACILLADTT